jgi:hypothetical protein
MTDKPLTAGECQEIEKRAEAATPGPWSTQKPAYEDGWPQGIVIGGTVGRQTIYGPLGGSYPANDQKFIAHSRTDVPALLASYRAAMELLRGAQDHAVCCSALDEDGVSVERLSKFCDCGLAKRQAAIAAYDADQAGRGQEA